MSKALLILGDSGSGKTASLMNLDPSTTLLIQSEKKDLPFRPKGWEAFNKDNLQGSINVNNDYMSIKAAMSGAVKAGKKVIVVDDTNYLMMGEEFRRVKETGFGKFAEMALHFLDLMQYAKSLPDDVIVVFLAHSQTSIDGRVSIKTTGKMLDEKVVVEGLFTMVMMCKVREGKHYFETKTNGNTPSKMPMGMFDSNEIENDLKMVVQTINDYYSGE